MSGAVVGGLDPGESIAAGSDQCFLQHCFAFWHNPIDRQQLELALCGHSSETVGQPAILHMNLHFAAIRDQGLATIPVCGSFVDVTEMGDCVGIEQRLLLFGSAVISSHSNANQDWAILRVVSCDSSYDGQLLLSIHAVQRPVDGHGVPGPTMIYVPALSDNLHVRSSVPDGSNVRIDTLCVPALAASPACLEASLFVFVAAFLSRSSCGFAGGRFVINVIASLPCIVIGMVRGGVGPSSIVEEVSLSCPILVL